MMENKTDMKQNTGERRVVLYCRVATDTDGGLALKAQKEQLRRYAEEQGYTIVEEITEVTKAAPCAAPVFAACISSATTKPWISC